jgi:hypothetical protein
MRRGEAERSFLLDGPVLERSAFLLGGSWCPCSLPEGRYNPIIESRII